VAFSLNDGQGAITVDSIIITVGNVNRNPVISAIADTFFVNEGDSIAITLSAIDPDSDAVYYNVANLPAGAEFDPAAGRFDWVPLFNQSGSYRIVFNAFDNRGGTAYEAVYIIVNQPPVWSAYSGKSTQLGVPLYFALYASDPDSDLLSYSAQNVPANAVVTYSDSVRFIWTPQRGQELGVYAVTFIENDGRGGTDEAVVPILVTDSNGQLPSAIRRLTRTSSSGSGSPRPTTVRRILSISALPDCCRREQPTIQRIRIYLNGLLRIFKAAVIQ